MLLSKFTTKVVDLGSQQDTTRKSLKYMKLTITLRCAYLFDDVIAFNYS
jgi:hypothetical protein